ncbi:MAG: Fic family protein [Patescibacteria group bacterium]
MQEPRFEITSQILENVGRIDAAREMIENAPLVPLWERRFKREAIERTVHYATALEGNALNYTEVKEILDKGTEHRVTAGQRDIQEVINYRKAIEYIDELLEKDVQIIDEEIVKHLNSLITDGLIDEDLRGKYREVPAISRNMRTMEKSLDWPDPQRVPWLMGQLFDWLSGKGREVHPILRAGVIHTWLVLIHPFSEGNGRTARILSTLSLCLDGYDIRRFFCLEEYYDQDAARYYQAIRAVLDSDGNYTDWLEYFTTGLALEFTRVEKRVLDLSRDASLKSSAGQVRLNPRQEKIILFVKDYGQIKNSDWQELFPDVSDDTILRDIKELVEKGVLVKRGKTKAARYEFP